MELRALPPKPEHPQKLDQPRHEQNWCPSLLLALCMIHVSYILNHLSCEALAGHVPLGMFYGVSQDINIILLYTFYQPVFYATHNQFYPSVSEERAAQWVVFGEHFGDTLTHKFLDDDTKKLLYRSPVRPSDSAHPNKKFVPDGGECS